MIGRGGDSASAGDTDEPTVQAAYAIGTAVFTGYAVWASLFPFDFHRVPMAIVARFWRDWTVTGVEVSWTDLVSNVLLFVPIGLFATAAVENTWPAWGKRKRTLAAIFGTGIALSAAIELGQSWVSWRTPSHLDVLAEALGTTCGMAIWRRVGAEIDTLLRTLVRTIRRATSIDRILLLYCGVFTVGWWVPADFTLRPSELVDKYQHLRLLLPFTPSPDAVTPLGLVVTAIAAVPLGIAALRCGCGPGRRRSVMGGSAVAALIVTAVELIQVPVFSRTTDGTAWLAAVAGSTAGAIAAGATTTAAVHAFDRAAMRALLLIAVWCAVTMTIEWWPFHVVFDLERARQQTMAWSQTPFRAPGSVLAVLPGALLAAAAGRLISSRLSGRLVRLQLLSIASAALAVYVAAEFGRILLDGGRPTLVSVLVKEAALAGGLFAGSAAASQIPGAAKPVDS